MDRRPWHPAAPAPVKNRFPRPSRLVLALVAVAALLLGPACGGSGGQRAQAAGGRIAWPKDGDLWVLNLGTNTQTKLTNLSSSTVVTGAAWSPDGKQIVYAQFGRRQGERASGADLLVADADGQNARVLLERDAPETAYESPQWMPSGYVYFAARRVRQGREQVTIERVREGGTPEQLVDFGFYPGVAPDESALVFVRTTRQGQELRRRSLTGNGAECVMLAEGAFQILGLPRFAPDGSQIALPASGEPGPVQGTCGQTGTGVRALAAAGHLAALLGLAPSVAYAHGLPWDVWSLKPDGSGLTRMVPLQEDEPTVTWSPDGKQVAIFGIAALYVADAAGESARKVVDMGGYGVPTWAP